MSRLLRIFFSVNQRRYSTDQQPTSASKDKKINLIYGGDLSLTIPNQSTGSFLFNRMLKTQRYDEILQTCLATGTEVTKKQFMESAVGLAERLKENGVQKGDFVLLVGNNSPNLNMALIGVLLLAAIPLPLSHRTRMDIFHTILKKVKPKFLGCEKRIENTMHNILIQGGDFDPTKTFPLDPGMEGFEGYVKGRGENFENFKPTEVEKPNKEIAVTLKSLSDGELGRVVGLTHENLNAFIARHENEAEQQRQKVYLMVQKVFWMSGLCDLLLSCYFGTKLIVMRRFQEEHFLRSVREYNVTDTKMFTATWWLLYKCSVPPVSDIQNYVTGYAIDDITPPRLKEEIKERYGINLYPVYVKSEVTGFFVHPQNTHFNGKCFGKLVPQLYGKVLSIITSEILGPNESGEVCVKGPLVSKGYINNAKANQNIFDKEGFLLTGLYGHYETTGEFLIMDFIDYQIKYKETRISPVKLEAIIRELDAVKDCCVMGVRHPTDGEYPIALVSVLAGQKITEAEIITHLNDKVEPEEQLRAGVIFVTKIPRFRHTGSIKRQALKKILSKYRMKSNEGEQKETFHTD